MNHQAEATVTFFQRYGSMVNSGLLLAIASGLLWLGSYRTEIERDIAANRNEIARNQESARLWREEHMAFHRERALEGQANILRLDERVKNMESERGRYENFLYRVTTLEGVVKELSASREVADEKLTKIATDVAIIKEKLVPARAGQP